MLVFLVPWTLNWCKPFVSRILNTLTLTCAALFSGFFVVIVVVTLPLRREFSKALVLSFLLMSYFSQGMAIFSQGCFGKITSKREKKIALKTKLFFWYSLTKTQNKAPRYCEPCAKERNATSSLKRPQSLRARRDL